MSRPVHDLGQGIAMGHASAEVQRQAQHVTADNTAEGFARAALELVLPRTTGC